MEAMLLLIMYTKVPLDPTIGWHDAIVALRIIAQT